MFRVQWCLFAGLYGSKQTGPRGYSRNQVHWQESAQRQRGFARKRDQGAKKVSSSRANLRRKLYKLSSSSSWLLLHTRLGASSQYNTSDTLLDSSLLFSSLGCLRSLMGASGSIEIEWAPDFGWRSCCELNNWMPAKRCAQKCVQMLSEPSMDGWIDMKPARVYRSIDGLWWSWESAIWEQWDSSQRNHCTPPASLNLMAPLLHPSI